jgi:hypothetical protein
LFAFCFALFCLPCFVSCFVCCVVCVDSILKVQVALAGSYQGFQDGIGSNTQMNHPIRMCFHPTDNCLYVSDFNNKKIRKVTMDAPLLI